MNTWKPAYSLCSKQETRPMLVLLSLPYLHMTLKGTTRSKAVIKLVKTS